MDARMGLGTRERTPSNPPPRVYQSLLNERAVELLDVRGLTVSGLDRAGRVGGDGDLVADGLTAGVDLLAYLGDLGVWEVGADEVGAVDDIDDEALASAGARRDDRHRAVERVHIGAIVQRDRFGLGFHQPERIGHRRFGDDLAQDVSILPCAELLSAPLPSFSYPILVHIAEIGETVLGRVAVGISRWGRAGFPNEHPAGHSHADFGAIQSHGLPPMWLIGGTAGSEQR